MSTINLEWLMQWALRSSALLAVAGLTVTLLRGNSASLRHAVWSIAIAGALAIPILFAALPGWHVLPKRTVTVAPQPNRPSNPVEKIEMVRMELATAPITPPTLADSDSEIPMMAQAQSLDLRKLALGVWVIGVLTCLARLLIGQSSILILRRRSKICQELTQGVPVKICGRAIPPMVTGLLKPTILLPTEALDWSEARLGAVLDHERAHVRRGDLWKGWIASCLCALQWFNPLVWIAAKLARAESEKACDDTVIRAGMSGTEYAGHLLEIATMAERIPAAQPAAAMASGPEVEGRLRYAIERDRDRGPLGFLARAGLAVMLAPLTLMLALADEAQDTEINQSAEVVAGEKDAEKKPAVALPAVGIAKDGMEISADDVDYQDGSVIAKGNVKLALEHFELSCQTLEYDTATGIMRVRDADVIFTGGHFKGSQGRANKVELDTNAESLKLSDLYIIDQVTRLLIGKTDAASATLDLKTGTITMDGPSITKIVAPKDKRKGEGDRKKQGDAPADEIPLADGFDFPVGAPDAEGYYIARGPFDRGSKHLGEDWNGKGGGNTDFGDPVYSIGHGKVILAEDRRVGWGNVVIIRHVYRDEKGKLTPIDSFYAHLRDISVAAGDIVKRGQRIGSIGNNRGMYLAMLHFEIRKRIDIGMQRSKFPRDQTSYHIPKQFIKAHRPQP